jgi:hypothetical protein
VGCFVRPIAAQSNPAAVDRAGWGAFAGYVYCQKKPKKKQSGRVPLAQR